MRKTRLLRICFANDYCVKAAAAYVHPNFKTLVGTKGFAAFANDVALLRTKKRIKHRQPSNLAPPRLYLGKGQKLEFLGFGLSKDIDQGPVAQSDLSQNDLSQFFKLLLLLAGLFSGNLPK